MKHRIVGFLTGTLGIVAVGVALLVIAPWKPSDPEPAVAAYSLCGVSLASVPDGVTTLAFPEPNPASDERKVFLVLETPRDPAVSSITDPKGRSHVAIDPVSGEVVYEFYRSDADRELLSETLHGLHVGPWELADTAEAVELPDSWRC